MTRITAKKIEAMESRAARITRDVERLSFEIGKLTAGDYKARDEAVVQSLRKAGERARDSKARLLDARGHLYDAGSDMNRRT